VSEPYDEQIDWLPLGSLTASQSEPSMPDNQLCADAHIQYIISFSPEKSETSLWLPYATPHPPQHDDGTPPSFLV
jgi:hypothetical protein